jgi:hypothetical protein
VYDTEAQQNKCVLILKASKLALSFAVKQSQVNNCPRAMVTFAAVLSETT